MDLKSSRSISFYVQCSFKRHRDFKKSLNVLLSDVQLYFYLSMSIDKHVFLNLVGKENDQVQYTFLLWDLFISSTQLFSQVTSLGQVLQNTL